MSDIDSFNPQHRIYWPEFYSDGDGHFTSVWLLQFEVNSMLPDDLELVEQSLVAVLLAKLRDYYNRLDELDPNSAFVSLSLAKTAPDRINLTLVTAPKCGETDEHMIVCITMLRWLDEEVGRLKVIHLNTAQEWKEGMPWLRI